MDHRWVSPPRSQVVNTNTSRSCAWNIARVVTFLKACVEESDIPVHANMGMGVGGLPLCTTPPIDAVSLASKAIVEITLADAPLNLSQGIRFFHHLLSQKVLYFSVEHDGPHDVDFDWMDEQEAVWEGRYVRHINLEEPVVVNVDGGRRRGLIRRSVD